MTQGTRETADQRFLGSCQCGFSSVFFFSSAKISEISGYSLPSSVRFVISLLKPAPASTRVAHERIDREYKRLRWQVFSGIFVGYAAFYLVRKNFALAMPDILKDYPQYSKAQLGWALTGLSVAYGVSKFIMGSVSDRSNPRWFMTLGLLLTAGVTFAFGAIPSIYGSLAAIVILQTLNGWFNGMGWPPCGKTMVHWWSTKERGLTVSSGMWRTMSAAELVAKLRAGRRAAFSRLGRQVLLQRGRGRAGRGARGFPVTRHAAELRAAADRGVQERLSARRTRQRTSARSASRRFFSATC